MAGCSRKGMHGAISSFGGALYEAVSICATLQQYDGNGMWNR